MSDACLVALAITLACAAFGAAPVFAQSHGGGEANLILPDLADVNFFGNSINGHKLLMIGF